MKHQVIAVAVAVTVAFLKCVPKKQMQSQLTHNIKYISIQYGIRIGIRECIQPYDCIINEHDL